MLKMFRRIQPKKAIATIVRPTGQTIYDSYSGAISNPSHAYDGSLSTFASISLTVGNHSAYIRYGFANVLPAGSKVIVKLGADQTAIFKLDSLNSALSSRMNLATFNSPTQTLPQEFTYILPQDTKYIEFNGLKPVYNQWGINGQLFDLKVEV